MLKEIKKELLNNPELIINLLNIYDFYKVHKQNNEIRCGFAEGHNPTAIRIKLINNDDLFVTDYIRNYRYDLITYIIKSKNVDFKEVIRTVKNQLGVTDFYEMATRKSVFGGFYDRIKNKSADLYVKTYPDTILNEFEDVYNTRFLRDNISFSAQDCFHIGYDMETQRITIPIYNACGEIIGIKARANWEVSEDGLKYYYVRACPMSSTLYGYCQNYQYMTCSDILVFEAEKSVLQCYSYGIRNAVALGSHSLSITQCKLIMELTPKRVIFMLDNGLEKNNTLANVNQLKMFTRMFDTEILWWDWSLAKNLPSKVSPSDMGKETLDNILNTQIRRIEND